MRAAAESRKCCATIHPSMQRPSCSLIVLLRSARNIKLKVPIGQQNQPPKDNLVHLLPNAECLDASWFLSLEDARSRCEAWRADYNEVRPHSSIGQKAPIELTNASGPACRP